MTVYEKVQLVQLNDFGDAETADSRQFRAEIKLGEESFSVILYHQGQQSYQFSVTSKCEFCRAGRLALVLNLSNVAVMMKFTSEKESDSFHSLLKKIKTRLGEDFCEFWLNCEGG